MIAYLSSIRFINLFDYLKKEEDEIEKTVQNRR